MTDADGTVRRILGQLQEATTAKDLDRLADLFDDDVVLFGTAAANLNRAQTMAYLALVVAEESAIRWQWDHILPLLDQPELLVFAVTGSVGLDDETGRPVSERHDFRLTCVAVAQDGRWRLRHFHGSVPQTD